MAKKLRCYLVLLIGSSLLLFAACTPQELEPVPVERRPTPVPTLVKMDRAVVEPLPDFISVIRPPEYHIIPLSLYNYHPPEGIVIIRVEAYDPTNPESYEIGFQSSICVKPRTELLVQEGDIFVESNEEGEKLEERMELFVDGRLIETGISHLGGLLANPRTREPESPQTIFFIEAGYCWKVPLGVGQYEVTFRFHQTSGDIKTYTWHFEISQ